MKHISSSPDVVPSSTATQQQPPTVVQHNQTAVRQRSALLLMLALFLLMAVGTFTYLAQEILIPITYAWLFSLLLSPLVDRLTRRGVSAPLAALLVLLVVGITVTGLGLLVAEPAITWFNELPSRLATLKSQLHDLRGSLSGVEDFGKALGQLQEPSPMSTEAPPIAVEVRNNDWVQALLLDELVVLVSAVLIVVFLTLFLLASPRHFLRFITRLGRNFQSKRAIVNTSHRFRLELSTYLLTITVINSCLGVVVGLSLSLMGMPNALFWGIVAGLVNFSPYVGPAIGALLMTLGSLSVFDSLSAAMLIPMVYIALTTVEGYVITPAIVGHQLSLNPTSVLLSVIFWTWMWGVPGALLAAPLLACFKILSENLSKFFSYREFIRL